jgi:hypothetical protein
MKSSDAMILCHQKFPKADTDDSDFKAYSKCESAATDIQDTEIKRITYSEYDREQEAKLGPCKADPDRSPSGFTGYCKRADGKTTDEAYGEALAERMTPEDRAARERLLTGCQYGYTTDSYNAIHCNSKPVEVRIVP